VKPGGRLAVLELSNPRTGLIGALARIHVHEVVPWMGALVSGDREYRYLARSIAAFPAPPEFAAIIESCGWRDVHARSLMFGCVTLFTATNPGGES
jgi:demethylmenaquinone methyltransferase/2-methoxy-6-polyprenyl-1,4-benzoquinol methylase